MSITALTGIAPEWFTPPQDGDEATATRFHLQPLNGLQYAEVLTMSDFDNGSVILNEKSMRQCLYYGLIGWENLNDATGRVVPFSPTAISDVPGSTLFAIAGKIFQLSMLAESDKKKS